MRRVINYCSKRTGMISLGVLLTCAVLATSQPAGYPGPNVILIDVAPTDVDAWCWYENTADGPTTDAPAVVQEVPLDDGHIENTASVVNSFITSGYTAQIQSSSSLVKSVHTGGEFYATYDSTRPTVIHFHGGYADADDSYVIGTPIPACVDPSGVFIHYTFFELDVTTMNDISNFMVTLTVDSSNSGRTLDIARDGDGGDPDSFYSDINYGMVPASNVYNGVSSFYTGSGDGITQSSLSTGGHASIPIFVMSMPPQAYYEAGGIGFGTLVSWVFEIDCAE
jgi:hypothetical protein